MNIRINAHGNGLPKRAEAGDWYDLSAAETVEMKAGEVRVISLGVSIELPEGCTAYILPRSSTPLKHGIIMANSIGVIDQKYNGDNDIIGFVAHAFRDTTIEKGTRIAQMAVYKSPERLHFIPVVSLGNKDRGGYGSTGER